MGLSWNIVLLCYLPVFSRLLFIFYYYNHHIKIPISITKPCHVIPTPSLRYTEIIENWRHIIFVWLWKVPLILPVNKAVNWSIFFFFNGCLWLPHTMSKYMCVWLHLHILVYLHNKWCLHWAVLHGVCLLLLLTLRVNGCFVFSEAAPKYVSTCHSSPHCISVNHILCCVVN